jgi:predicted RNA-binding protein associated with RNAse of E/G family
VGFARGRLILHRNVRHGVFGWVRPVRVVYDDERGLLLWLAPGTPVVHEVAADGRGMRSMPFAEWVTLAHRPEVVTWNGPGVLKFHPRDADHSVWWFRRPDGRFAGWYVNLEERMVRWDDGPAGLSGIDVVDQDLDIWVPPDRRWSWKDEDEFAERLGFPEHYWVRDETAVRAEGERVVKRIEAGEFPFDGTWLDFRPDPAWEAPALPAGWDRLAAVR